MARRLALLAAAALALLATAQPAAGASLDALVARDLKFAATQLNRTLAEVPTGAYPHMTNADGTWGTHTAGWWTSGFFPGSLWMMYRATGDPAWRTAAAARQAGIESQKTRTNTHDLGFMIFDSFGNGWKLTGDDAYRQVVLTAAGSLDTRYSSIVHAIRSWDNTSSDSSTDFKVIVDNIMNLELLDWASKNGGSSSYAAHALEHALTTAREHVRTDGSTFHLVVFDQNTGAVRRKETVQGYSNTSTWSRGQAWALYGFTLAYRETKDARMLDTARRVADYYLSHLPADSVPYWDFQAPNIPNEPRDSSAAAIAATGLIELAQLDPSVSRGRRYLGRAEDTLASLSTPAYLAQGTSSRSILLHGTANKPGGESDRGLVYGDYFFLEALLRYREMVEASNPRADFNGDGYADLAAGAIGEDNNAGAVGVMYGSATGITGSGSRQLGQNASGGTTEDGDRLGAAVAAGDFNRDGYSDLAAGAPSEDAGFGAVNVVNGSASGLTSTGAKQLNLVDAGGTNDPGAEQFGSALTSGDYNGDGYADLAVGVPNSGSSDQGSVAVFYGSAAGLTGTGARRFSQSGAGGSPGLREHFGQALASGDFNGDFKDDLAIGAPGDATSSGVTGEVNIVLGSSAGITSTGATQMTQASTGGAAEGGDQFGAALAAGRFDGDGFTDLAVGAPGEATSLGASVGAVSVLHGSESGITSARSNYFDQGSAAGTAEYRDRFGAALAAGDFDRDGHTDLVMGAPGESTSAGRDVGVVNVLNGTATGLTKAGAVELDQSAAGGTPEPGNVSQTVPDAFGSALAAGDFDGDSRSDLAIGVPNEDVGAPSLAGVVNLLVGTAGGIATSGGRELTQATVPATPEPSDQFGFAVR